MIHKATATTVRQNLSELLDDVQLRHDSVLITEAGKPIAALVDIELFEKIYKLRDRFEQLTAELASTYQGVDENIAEAEINEASQNARRDEK